MEKNSKQVCRSEDCAYSVRDRIFAKIISLCGEWQAPFRGICISQLKQDIAENLSILFFFFFLSFEKAFFLPGNPRGKGVFSEHRGQDIKKEWFNKLKQIKFSVQQHTVI